MLTTREYQIITKLLDAKQEITIKELSTELNVSVRTIKYDLESVREWFLSHDMILHSRPNKGIWIDEDEVKRNRIREFIYNDKPSLFLVQDDRVKEIIKMLILEDDYLTALDISEHLLVSRNTIVSDFNLVEEYIEPWQVTLQRQPRAGFRINGEELHKRILLEHIIQSKLSNYDVYQIMMSITSKGEKNNFIIDPSLREGYELAEKYLREVFESHDYDSFESSHLLSILFRLTISIARLQMGHTLDSYRVVNESLYQHGDEKMVLQVMKKVYEDMKFPLFEDEYHYVLRGTEKSFNQVDLVKVTEQIIQYVSEKEGVNYKNDSRLYSNLLAHLSLRFQNGAISITEYNPFTDEIKRNYPELFNNIKKACGKYIKNQAMVTQDSFVSYITLHFLVVHESARKKRKAKAIYVCATGKGVARLIKNRVEGKVSNIDIVAYCSMIEVEAFCQEEEVDLIISVFPLDVDVPVIIVDGLPTRLDIEKIQQQVDKVISKKGQEIDDYLNPQSSQEKFHDNSEEISQEIILKGFEITQEISELFEDHLDHEKMNALKMHIFLMVHRYYFDKQYDNYIYNSKQKEKKNILYLEKLQELFKSKELFINEAELDALLQYFQ